MKPIATTEGMNHITMVSGLRRMASGSGPTVASSQRHSRENGIFIGWARFGNGDTRFRGNDLVRVVELSSAGFRLTMRPAGMPCYSAPLRTVSTSNDPAGRGLSSSASGLVR